MDGKIEIDIQQLKEEVKDFLLSLERDRITPKPIQRIGEIMFRLRQYKMAVVKANVPRAFAFERPGHKQIRMLREHRQEQFSNTDPQIGLAPLKDWLTALDCAFVLGGELFWRLDNVTWESEVWTPIYEWVERGYAMLLDDAGRKSEPKPIAPDVLAKWEAEEKDVEYRLFSCMTIFVPTKDLPVVDDNEPFTIRWRGCRCCLGDNDGFKIMKRLIRAKGQPVSIVNIRLEIANNDLGEEALRKAASRLKRALEKAGMGELAKRIRTRESGRSIIIDVPDREELDTLES